MAYAKNDVAIIGYSSFELVNAVLRGRALNSLFCWAQWGYGSVHQPTSTTDTRERFLLNIKLQ